MAYGLEFRGHDLVATAQSKRATRAILLIRDSRHQFALLASPWFCKNWAETPLPSVLSVDLSFATCKNPSTTTSPHLYSTVNLHSSVNEPACSWDRFVHSTSTTVRICNLDVMATRVLAHNHGHVFLLPSKYYLSLIGT